MCWVKKAGKAYTYSQRRVRHMHQSVSVGWVKAAVGIARLPDLACELRRFSVFKGLSQENKTLKNM